MKLFSAQQIKAWDAYTIAQEPIPSVDLMERAAQSCTDWMIRHFDPSVTFKIFCGKGNNGGDGLAMARLLHQKGFKTFVYILEFGKLGSEDFQTNLQRLHALPVPIVFIQSSEHFPLIRQNDVVIDALFGSGLNKPLAGVAAALVAYINENSTSTLSIDVPSGLFMDQTSKGNTIIKANHILTFEVNKLALLLAENAPYIGEVHVLPIGFHPQFAIEEPTTYELLTAKGILNIFKKRQRFAHKGTYGHALVIGGSWGKTGAVVLTAKAALRSGVGLLTAYVPRSSYVIMQSSIPEAMTITDASEEKITALPDNLDTYAAIGAGPGLGTGKETEAAILQLVEKTSKPLVLDADALNILAKNKRILKHLPHYSVLTPHPKEAERLFGPCENDFERLQQASAEAKALQCIVVLKGHHTFIAMPDGKGYFNSTGNAGMAKGGSGDVLTGIITSLLAQGYTPQQAALLGVYLHGAAGDAAALALGQEPMLPTDLVHHLSTAFKTLNS